MSDIKEQHKHTAIMYTDGSAGPSNPGYYGGGCHGYIYTTDGVGVKSGDKPTNYTVTTVGYVEKDEVGRYISQKEHIPGATDTILINGKTYNYNTVVPTHYYNAAYSYFGIGSNNMGEICGVLETMVILLQLDDIEFDKFVFKTDSTYVIGIVETLLAKKGRNWDVPSKPNIELWRRLEKAIDECISKNIQVSMVKVKGHSTSLGNNIADRLAYIGRNNSQHEVYELKYDLRTSKKYWKPNNNKHDLINFKQLFFTKESRNLTEYNMYTIMDYPSDVEIGKKTNEALFGLVKLSQPEELIEEVIEDFKSFMGTTSILSSVNLLSVYKQNHTLLRSIFGNRAYSYNKLNGIMRTTEEDILVNNINPPGLATQAMIKTLSLYTILSNYTEAKNTPLRTYVDITDYIYEENAKGKVMCKIANGEKILPITINIDGVDIDIKLLLGLDTISRNQLKRIEGKDTKVTLIVDKPSNQFIEYYCVVDMQATGDVGLYCNFYSNKVFFPKKKK